MPKRGLIALAITTGALILLLSFKTPDEGLPGRPVPDVAIVGSGSKAAAPANPTFAALPRASAATSGPSAPPRIAPTPSTAATGAGGSAATTIDGPVVATRFGSIQVEIVVAGGRLQDVVALQLPTGRRSGQISSYSEPILRAEALQAQSASIDLVSGATYTSDAYAQSLQSAIDQAGIG